MRNLISGRRHPWALLMSALVDIASDRAALLRHVERPWASVTFSGTHHTFALAFVGAEAVVAGKAFIAALPDHEFTIPRQLVADAVVVMVEHEALPEPMLKVEVELLLLEDA